MRRETLTFHNEAGQALVGILQIPDGIGPFPAVLLCHGFKGNKDRELMFDIANALTYRGFLTFRFDFHGHGESYGEFEHFTHSQALRDIKTAIDYLETLPQTDKSRMGIVGHSLGGMLAILHVPHDKRIKAVCSIAARADAQELVQSYFNDHEILQWKREGSILLQGQYKLNVTFLQDLEKHDVLGAVPYIQCPLLILQGTMDMRVPYENANRIFQAAQCDTALEFVEGADHNFRDAAYRQEMIDILVAWLLAKL